GPTSTRCAPSSLGSSARSITSSVGLKEGSASSTARSASSTARSASSTARSAASRAGSTRRWPPKQSLWRGYSSHPAAWPDEVSTAPRSTTTSLTGGGPLPVAVLVLVVATEPGRVAFVAPEGCAVEPLPHVPEG